MPVCPRPRPRLRPRPRPRLPLSTPGALPALNHRLAVSSAQGRLRADLFATMRYLRLR